MLNDIGEGKVEGWRLEVGRLDGWCERVFRVGGRPRGGKEEEEEEEESLEG